MFGDILGMILREARKKYESFIREGVGKYKRGELSSFFFFFISSVDRLRVV